MSAKDKDSKKKEELKPFTVGSVAPSTSKAKKAPKAQKVEVSEKDFPVLAGLARGNDAKAFNEEMLRVLTAVQQSGDSGSEDDRSNAEKIKKAYGMAIAIIDNAKVVR